jgi:hypothetical protein
MHLLAEQSVFWGDDRGFLKEGVKTHLMAPLSPLNSPILFSVFTSIVYEDRSLFVSKGVQDNVRRLQEQEERKKNWRWFGKWGNTLAGSFTRWNNHSFSSKTPAVPFAPLVEDACRRRLRPWLVTSALPPRRRNSWQTARVHEKYVVQKKIKWK